MVRVCFFELAPNHTGKLGCCGAEEVAYALVVWEVVVVAVVLCNGVVKLGYCCCLQQSVARPEIDWVGANSNQQKVALNVLCRVVIKAC